MCDAFMLWGALTVVRLVGIGALGWGLYGIGKIRGENKLLGGEYVLLVIFGVLVILATIGLDAKIFITYWPFKS